MNMNSLPAASVILSVAVSVVPSITPFWSSVAGEEFMLVAADKDDIKKSVFDITNAYAYKRLVSLSTMLEIAACVSASSASLQFSGFQRSCDSLLSRWA